MQDQPSIAFWTPHRLRSLAKAHDKIQNKVEEGELPLRYATARRIWITSRFKCSFKTFKLGQVKLYGPKPWKPAVCGVVLSSYDWGVPYVADTQVPEDLEWRLKSQGIYSGKMHFS